MSAAARQTEAPSPLSPFTPITPNTAVTEKKTPFLKTLTMVNIKKRLSTRVVPL